MTIKLSDGEKIDLSYDTAEMLYDELSKMFGPQAVEENVEWDELHLALGCIEEN